MTMTGWNGTVDSAVETSATNRDLIRDIAAAGFPTISCAVDSTFGNSTMRTRMSTLKTNAQTSLFASGKVHLYGLSMGGACVLNWAKNNPTLVQSIALIIPAINLQRLYDDDPADVGISAAIDTAYGGRPADSENPVTYAADLDGIPIKCWYSTDDYFNTEVSDYTDFAAASGAELVSMGNSGHDIGPPLTGGGVTTGVEIANFFLANN